MSTPTSAERVARFRDQLSGARAESRSARRLRQSPAANVLIAVVLHAAARREAGLELTGLEQRLSDQFTALYGDGLLAEFGRIYQEPAARAGAVSLFPALVTDRPLKEGIEAEDVRAFVAGAAAEIAALPTVAHISVGDLERGGPDRPGGGGDGVRAAGQGHGVRGRRRL
ncbi:hypothetical protein AB0K89_22945 [Streptomyces cinnamoneus]|uniref:hypothetical protein n=1 Tax=Streptomyces cinnamoneus TaxID=53446 RepID=UPI00341356D7